MTTPTTAAVPSASPLDLLFNAEKIDEAVNTSALTYADRFGVQRMTLSGAMARISAVNVRGAWVTATVYAPRDVVQNSGTWYISLTNHTAGATFAGDLAANWRVYQGVVAAELSNTSNPVQGAAMVGFDATFPYLSGVGLFLSSIYARTAGEIAAGVTPSSYWFKPGDIRRYGAVSVASPLSASDATKTAITLAIQQALDSSPDVYAPPGNFPTNAALLFNDNNMLIGSGAATQFYPTHNGAFMAGKAVTPSSGTNVRRYNGGGQNFMIYGPGVASTSSIALDLRGCTAFKFWNVRVQNIHTAVRQGNNYSTYYNEFHACDISTVVNGYLNDTLGNENKVFGGRVADSVTATTDSDNSGNLYNGLACEVFTTAHKVAAPTSQFIRFRDSRLENATLSGLAYDIDANSEDIQISGGQVSNVANIITEVSAGVPTGRRTRVSLSEYESFFSGKKVSKHTSAAVTKDIAALAAGAFRQESLTVPGVLTGDSVSFTAPVAWPNLIAGPCIVGGTDLVYMMLFNPTGASVDAVSMTFAFDVWRH